MQRWIKYYCQFLLSRRISAGSDKVETSRCFEEGWERRLATSWCRI